MPQTVHNTVNSLLYLMRNNRLKHFIAIVALWSFEEAQLIMNVIVIGSIVFIVGFFIVRLLIIGIFFANIGGVLGRAGTSRG